LGIGDWGLWIGDWGLGIGHWGLGPIPNPQSPIPNPQSPFKACLINNKVYDILIIYNYKFIDNKYIYDSIYQKYF